MPLSVAVAAARERAIQIQLQRITLAAEYCEIADQAFGDEKVAAAVLNYRRATMIARNSEPGQVAARAIGTIQKDAEAELKKVDQLIIAREFDQAIERLGDLRRDYLGLSIGPRIEQAGRRARRLRASEGVAMVEPRLRADRADAEPPVASEVESDQPREPRASDSPNRETFASIRKLAKLASDDSAGPRARDAASRQ